MLLILLVIAIAFVALEDSDRVTFGDFTDFSTFHHEHVILILSSALMSVAFYPTSKIQKAHVHVTAILFLFGFLLLSVAFTNLPDNLSFFGAGGINGRLAYLGGAVANLSSVRQVLAGVTVNYTLITAGTSAAVVTDANGSFLVLVPVGSYSVRFNKTGYKSDAGTVTVFLSRGAHLLVFLQPANLPGPSPVPMANTNTTNTPPPPPPPWWATSAAACIYSQETTPNGSVILRCTIKLGPISQITAALGVAIAMASVGARAWFDRKEARRR